MRRLIAAVFSLLAWSGGGQASAAPIDDITAQVSKCLKVPPGAPASYRFHLRVEIVEGSVQFVSASPMDHALPTAWEMVAAPMITQATIDCEPYGKVDGKPSYTFGILVDQNLVRRSNGSASP